MSVTLPLWLVAAQWVLVFALGGLVIVMYRQVGYYQQLRRTGPENAGLVIGQPAPAFEFIGSNGRETAKQSFSSDGRWSLLLFADPQCGGCERALYALDAVRKKGLAQEFRTLVITSADARRTAESGAFQVGGVEIAHDADGGIADLYHIRQTPFAYVVDPTGVIRAKGMVVDQASWRALLARVRRPTFPLVPVGVSPSNQS